MSDHASYRDWAGAYVLGALDDDERSEFKRHLEECEPCRRDVAELAAIPALLARVESPERPIPPDAVIVRAKQRIAAERAALVRSRRRWQWGAAVAALLAAVAVVVVVGLAATGEPEPREAVALVVETEAVPASITVSARAWGTAIDLELDELPPLDQYVAWAVDTAGTWEQVAIWGPTPTGRAIVSGASSFAAADLASVVVTSADRSTTLVTARPAG